VSPTLSTSGIRPLEGAHLCTRRSSYLKALLQPPSPRLGGNSEGNSAATQDYAEIEKQRLVGRGASALTCSAEEDPLENRP